MTKPHTEQRMNPLASKLIEAVGRTVHGKQDAIELAVTALLAGGHLLVEDLPGVGKTLMARSLALSLDLPFQRIQCTADLLPSDLIGAQIYHPRTGDLTFRKGPVFTSVLMADELNRTPPRTQSALLECMAERRVTVDVGLQVEVLVHLQPAQLLRYALLLGRPSRARPARLLRHALALRLGRPSRASTP